MGPDGYRWARMARDVSAREVERNVAVVAVARRLEREGGAVLVSAAVGLRVLGVPAGACGGLRLGRRGRGSTGGQRLAGREGGPADAGNAADDGARRSLAEASCVWASSPRGLAM